MRCRPRMLLPVLLTCLPLLHADSSATRPIAPGVTHMAQRLDAGPWEVRVVRMKRNAPRVRLDMALGMGMLRGVEQMSGIVARETAPEDTVVAGVNADFFVMAGNPNAGLVSGMAVRRGELIMMPRRRPAFWVTADGVPHIGTPQTRGTLTLDSGQFPVTGINQPPAKDGVTVYTSDFGWPVDQRCLSVVPVPAGTDAPLTPECTWRGRVFERVPPGSAREIVQGELLLHGAGAAEGAVGSLMPGDRVVLTLHTPGLGGKVEAAVGGNQILLRGGRILPKDDPKAPRHPRTIVGFNAKEILLVTVDGRQRGWSVGMTPVEEARLMLRLGCTDALNLDGGGSTTCWVRGTVTNRPSDGGQRKIANALLVRSTAPHGPLARLTVEPDGVWAVSRAQVPLTLTATDLWYNPVDLDSRALQVSVRRLTGHGWMSARLIDGALRVAGLEGTGMVRFSLPGVGRLAEVPLTIVGHCDALKLTPSLVQLCVGETFELAAQGVMEDGSSVWLPPRGVGWEVDGAGVTALGGGQFRADVPGSQATVRAALAGAVGSATVQVVRDVAVEGFEATSELKTAVFPETEGVVTAKGEVLATDAGEGTRFARLTYDLGTARGTRAAYLRLDRNLGSALRLSALTRGTATSPVWLRVAVIDGNGTRQTYTLADAVTWSQDWRRVSVRLPDGLKQPLQWESVYVVALDGKTGRGTVDVDDLRAETAD